LNFPYVLEAVRLMYRGEDIPDRQLENIIIGALKGAKDRHYGRKRRSTTAEEATSKHPQQEKSSRKSAAAESHQQRGKKRNTIEDSDSD
jgi:hypothetical protein